MNGVANGHADRNKLIEKLKKQVKVEEDASTTDIDHIANNYRNILVGVGEDPHRDGLLKTPHRAAKAMEFFTQGYRQSLEEIVNGALFDVDHKEMVVVKDIEMFSLCEHHLVPFFGKVSVGYIPNRKVIGLSKVARIVDMFARRLQVQERMTKEIANAIAEAIESEGVGVVIEASHMCMMMRGVQKTSSTTVTSVMLGTFLEDSRTRQEFMLLVKN